MPTNREIAERFRRHLLALASDLALMLETSRTIEVLCPNCHTVFSIERESDEFRGPIVGTCPICDCEFRSAA